MIPAARGAAADVPVWLTVHVLLLSVVAWNSIHSDTRTLTINSLLNLTKHAATHDFLITIRPAGVGGRQGTGTFLTVPRELALLRGRT